MVNVIQVYIGLWDVANTFEKGSKMRAELKRFLKPLMLLPVMFSASVFPELQNMLNSILISGFIAFYIYKFFAHFFGKTG